MTVKLENTTYIFLVWLIILRSANATEGRQPALFFRSKFLPVASLKNYQFTFTSNSGIRAIC